MLLILLRGSLSEKIENCYRDKLRQNPNPLSMTKFIQNPSEFQKSV